jgi:hypothetical protein
MKNILTAFFIVMIATNLFSQKHELGKVTIEELTEKKHPIDTSAVAAVLFSIGEVRFEYSDDAGFDMYTTAKIKIKIYKKDGYQFANFVRKYYIGGISDEVLNFSKATTYNIVNGKIEKTKLKSEGEFTEKINRFWNQKKITMPNVKEGSIIEFEYTLKSPSIGSIDEWEFQSNIPVNFSEFTTYIPEYFTYNVRQKGYIFPSQKKDAKQRLINYSYMEKFVPGANTGFPQRINTSMEFIENKTVFTAENLPALKDESFVNNIKNYLCSITHELSMISYPNQPLSTFSTDWETITKTIYQSEEFGGELNKTGYFEDDIKNLLTESKTVVDKIASIFNFVKTKVKWNDYLGYYCNDGVRKAYKDGTGNIAEINLMLVAMLRFAGLEANPVLVSTRSNGIALFPNRTAYNYVIAAVEIENDIILLDASDRNSVLNILPFRIIRKNGSSSEVNLMPEKTSNNIINVLATISADGQLAGKVREQHFDYFAYAFRNRFGLMAKDNYLEYLEKRNNNSEIEGYEVAGKEELNQQVTENYSFKNTNLIEVVGDKMYFSPMLFFAQKESPFKQENREYPIDFTFPTNYRYLINITIPEDYTIESFPKSVSIPMSENYVSAKFIVSGEENKIQLSYTREVNTSIISPEYYEELKAVFNEVVKKENEKIVLKKK